MILSNCKPFVLVFCIVDIEVIHRGCSLKPMLYRSVRCSLDFHRFTPSIQIYFLLPIYLNLLYCCQQHPLQHYPQNFVSRELQQIHPRYLEQYYRSAALSCTLSEEAVLVKPWEKSFSMFPLLSLVRSASFASPKMAQSSTLLFSALSCTLCTEDVLY